MYKEDYETREGALYRERELKKWKSSKRIIKEFKIDIEIYGSSDPAVAG